MYEIVILQKAEDQLKKFDKSLQLRIINVLERIKIRPFHFTKRKEGSPYFIARIGEYRAVLDIQQKNSRILVLKMGHRKNVYD